ADLPVEVHEQQYGTRGDGPVRARHAQRLHVAAPALQMLARTLVARIRRTTGAVQQLDRIELRDALGDVLVAGAAADARDQVRQLVQQGAGAVLADQRALAVHVQ